MAYYRQEVLPPVLPTATRQVTANLAHHLLGGVMVRWRVSELLVERGWTVYRLVQESDLAPTVVYRLAKPGVAVKRIDGRTLDALCAALKVGPGELLEYTADREPRKRGR
jgi:DNA-binding Xre family transcriptional regulator